MKPSALLHRRAFAALVPAMVVLAPPGVAQDIKPLTTAPPPAQTATPPVQTATPPVQTASPPVPAAIPPGQAVAPVAPTVTPQAERVTPPPVVPTLTSTATQADEPAATTRATRTTTRTARATSAQRQAVRSRPAPVDAAPAPAAVTPAPAAPEPETLPAQPPVEAVAPAPVTDTAPLSTAPVAPGAAATWPWLLGGLLVVIAAIAGMMGLRRRRSAEEAHHEEPAIAKTAAPAAPIGAAKPAPTTEREPQFLRPGPVAAAAPVAAAPRAAASAAAAAAPIAAANDETAQVPTEDAELAKPVAAEVEALTAGDPPVADRPWLEFAMRPIRAGTNVDEALVEIELTVGNSGSVAAEDVRISTFMFANAPGTDDEMSRLLIERGEDSGAPAVTIKPGEGTRLDATLALPRAGLDPTKDDFVPIVVANARYRLPDGSEGRTSASFTIGVHTEGGMAPIQTDRALMHEDVEARLYGKPERV